MLKMTGINLKLILDINMYLFVEKGMREGISYIAKRLSKVNDKYMQSSDNKKKQVNIYIWMQLICMVEQGVNIYLNGFK